MAQTNSAASLQTLDREHLARYTLGNADLEREILSLFCQQLRDLLHDAGPMPTEAEWTFTTHSVKGAARAVGAWELAETAAVLETRKPNRGALTRLRTSADRAIGAAESYCVPTAPDKPAALTGRRRRSRRTDPASASTRL